MDPGDGLEGRKLFKTLQTLHWDPSISQKLTTLIIMERGDEKEEYNITTRQTFIAKVETIKHLSLLSVFLSLNLWILRFSWVASVLTLGLREESRRKIISGGYWGVMQRFNASGISSSCSVPGWQPELGRWEMAATDQWEAETVTRQPIRCQLRDTDSTVQTPETSHQREKLGNIPISSHLVSSQLQIKLQPYI